MNAHQKIFADQHECHLDFHAEEKVVTRIIAENLRHLRIQAEFSQSKVAKLIDVSLAQYKKYEGALEIPKVDTVAKWSLRFGVPFFSLFHGTIYQSDNNYIDSPLKCFRASFLTDEYFNRLITILDTYLGTTVYRANIDHYGLTKENFNSAIEEVNSTLYSILGMQLANFRRTHGFSQEAMSEKVQISLSSYQQYEKPGNKPRFNVCLAGRFYRSTGCNPLELLQNTQYALIRKTQNQRMALFQKIIEPLSDNKKHEVQPIFDGFFSAIENNEHALLT